MKKSKKQKCAFDLLPFHVIEAISADQPWPRVFLRTR